MISLFNFFGGRKKETNHNDKPVVDNTFNREPTEDEKDLLLAMEVVAKDLSNKKGFKLLHFARTSLKAPQIACKVEGSVMTVIVKVCRYPRDMPLLTDEERALKNTYSNLHFAPVGLMPAEMMGGDSGGFMVNYRGLEKV